MSLCLLAAGTMRALHITAFTLAWTHSVEKIEWQEDWRVTTNGLQIVAARVKGTGAGMEPPSQARLAGGWWHWRPDRPVQPLLVLGNASAAGDWRLCGAGASCEPLSEFLGNASQAETIVLSACPARGD